ncbi:MAG: hypothetical protein ABSD48_10115 [Armatimonadota bacterium]
MTCEVAILNRQCIVLAASLALPPTPHVIGLLSPQILPIAVPTRRRNIEAR